MTPTEPTDAGTEATEGEGAEVTEPEQHHEADDETTTEDGDG